MPGMPNMQMYSREEMMEEMAKQSMQSGHEEKSDSSKHPPQYQGGELSIWETIFQMFIDSWNWIIYLLGIRGDISGDL